ncbi:hypothetical protein N665_2798s0003 [Sinapis alba]|nr:hypothetical protein N665_2798s0003 [Sinapis alba]
MSKETDKREQNKPKVSMAEAVGANAGEDKRRRCRDLVLVTRNRRKREETTVSRERSKDRREHASPVKWRRGTDGAWRRRSGELVEASGYRQRRKERDGEIDVLAKESRWRIHRNLYSLIEHATSARLVTYSIHSDIEFVSGLEKDLPNILCVFDSFVTREPRSILYIRHGRKYLELQKWLHLRFAVNLLPNKSAFSVNPCRNVLSSLSNSFSSPSAATSDVSPRQDVRKGNNFTVSYLVDSLGFTTKLGQSIWKKVSSEGKANPDSVLTLLRSHGFTDSHISTIITNYPRLLILDAERSLALNLKFLQSRGDSTSELTEIVSNVPRILGMRRQKAVGRYYDFVKDIIEADKSSNYEMSCLSIPQGSSQENIIRNVLALRQLGVPQRLLFSLLTSNFNVVSGKERFEESLKKIVDMGFDPTTARFVKALCVVFRMSDRTTEDKVNHYRKLGFRKGDVWEIFKKNPLFLALSEKNVLKSFETFIGLGFSRDEFVTMVKQCPQCVGLSAETVKKKTEFLVKEMNWSLKAVVSNPVVFGYNLEKRTVPRCNVIRALMSKGLLGGELPPLSPVLAVTEEAFLNKYVRKHDDKELVAELMAVFVPHRSS